MILWMAIGSLWVGHWMGEGWGGGVGLIRVNPVTFSVDSKRN